MEGLSRRHNATVALDREFINSRLEKQILMRAFALLLPPDGAEPITEESGKAEAEQPHANTVPLQGGLWS